MKIPALIAALALGCGSAAIAAQTKDADVEAGRSHSTVATSDQKASGGGVVDKTKNALRRMGDKMRNAGNRISGKVANKGNSSGQKSAVRDGEQDTRAMGAAGSNPAEQARQARMDEAYSNWQSKQK